MNESKQLFRLIENSRGGTTIIRIPAERAYQEMGFFLFGTPPPSPKEGIVPGQKCNFVSTSQKSDVRCNLCTLLPV